MNSKNRWGTSSENRIFPSPFTKNPNFYRLRSNSSPSSFNFTRWTGATSVLAVSFTVVWFAPTSRSNSNSPAPSTQSSELVLAHYYCCTPTVRAIVSGSIFPSHHKILFLLLLLLLKVSYYYNSLG